MVWFLNRYEFTLGGNLLPLKVRTISLGSDPTVNVWIESNALRSTRRNRVRLHALRCLGIVPFGLRPPAPNLVGNADFDLTSRERCDDLTRPSLAHC